MTIWMVASIALNCGLGLCLAACLRSDASGSLAALNLAGMITVLEMVTLTVAFDRQPFVDLAVILAPLSMGGTLAFARFLERRR
jgi:multisubunit Na+/H+ antiporter MnhF subunit